MAGVGYTAVANRQRQLIRKAKEGGVFIAPLTADDYDETVFTDPTDHLLMPLPNGFSDLGLTSADGVAFASTINKSDVTSWGFTSPTRTDMTSEDTTATIAFQETNKQTLALYTGVDPEAVTATNGVTALYRPLIPLTGEYHVLFLAVDHAPEGDVYIARYWPVATLTDKSNQSLSGSGDPVLWSVQLSARPSEVLGTAEVALFGGPGWVAQLEAMGITETVVDPG